MATNALEQIACLGQVAGALVQVAERVPHPHVVLLHAMLLGAPPGERAARARELGLGAARAAAREPGELVTGPRRPDPPAARRRRPARLAFATRAGRRLGGLSHLAQRRTPGLRSRLEILVLAPELRA